MEHSWQTRTRLTLKSSEMKVKIHTEVPATEWGTEMHTPSQSFTDPREVRKINSQIPHAAPQLTNT